ncbi:ABC transporter permease [Helicovermis profundi]|uniref:ABC transporter permease n=1 Tax=Helicovermis profundi TaxID=3065157 RepID=A0AAU9ESA5_9FIRM|nr:ABC transporter permease [Clostridia bacterium S502]
MSLKIEIKKFFSVPKNIVFLILGPLFFTLFFGLVYSNDYLNDVSMAVLDLDNSNLSRNVVREFDNNDRYDVLYYVKNMDELKNLVDSKKVYTGLFIPPNFEKNINNKKGEALGLLVDGTNIAIGNNAMATGTKIISSINKDITVKFLEDDKKVPEKLANNYANIFNITTRVLWDPKLSYKYYVMPGIILVLIQQLFLSVFTLNYIKNKENVFAKAFVHIIVSGLAFFISLNLLIKVLHINVLGNIYTATFMSMIYLMCLTGVAMVIGNIAKTRLVATQFCMMMSIPSFFTAGYVWPLFKMPHFIVIILKGVWPLIYMVSPLRDFIIKGVFPVGFTLNLAELFVFGIVWFGIGTLLSKRIARDKVQEEL